MRLSSFQTGVVNAFQETNATGAPGDTVFGGWDFINKIQFGDTDC